MPNSKGKPGRYNLTAFVGILLLFLVSRLFLAMAYAPAETDTELYAMYGLSAQKGTESKINPYVQIQRDHGHVNNTGGKGEHAVEYPPAALLLMKSVAAGVITSGEKARIAQWQGTYRILSFGIDCLIFGWLSWLWFSGKTSIQVSLTGLAAYVISGILMYYFLYERLDIWLAGFCFLAVLLMVSGRGWGLAFAVLALAINFKVVPVILLPLFVLGSLPAAMFLDRRPVTWITALSFRSAAAALLCLSVFVPFLLLWGPQTLAFSSYHAARGIQIESVISSLLMPWQYLGYPMLVDHRFGAYNLVTNHSEEFARLATALSMLAVLGIAAGYFLKTLAMVAAEAPPSSRLKGKTVAAAYPETFVLATVLTLAGSMVTSKVLSPQYFVWLIPFAAILSVKSRQDVRIFLALAAAFVLTTPIYPHLYGYLVHMPVPSGLGFLSYGTPEAPGIALLLARNLALLTFVVLLSGKLFRGAVRQRSRSAGKELTQIPQTTRASL